MQTLRRGFFIGTFLILSLSTGVYVHAQREPAAPDPGTGAEKVDAGKPLATLTNDQLQFFLDGQSRFAQVDSVSGTAPGEPGTGLGPTFNSNSCASCHAQPSMGGTSPSASQYPTVGPHPHVAVVTDYGAANTLPSFIALDGPVREVRFPFAVST